MSNTSHRPPAGTDLVRTRVSRAGIVLMVVVALLAFALKAHAQQNAGTIRPVVGALVAVGSQHDAMKNAVLVGGQASYAFDPYISATGTLAWAHSQDMLSAQQPTLDLYQYDIGLEGRLGNLSAGAPVSTRPYIAFGGGGRTYDLRHVPQARRQTSPLLYSAIGLALDHTGGVLGLRLEVRDNITAFKGFYGEFADRMARHDLQLSAGLTLGL